MQLSFKQALCGNKAPHHWTRWWLIVGRVTLNRRSNYLGDEIYRPFEQPWHAEVFAVTVHLSETNLFSWVEWTQTLGQHIIAANTMRVINGTDDYYQVWLRTLIALLSVKEVTDLETIASMQNRWAEAYRNTPHGEPVNL